MSTVYKNPDFVILTHHTTKEKTGRIYFPALWLAENHAKVTAWLKSNAVVFTERDLKIYSDGSFRLYFKASAKEYSRLKQIYCYQPA